MIKNLVIILFLFPFFHIQTDAKNRMKNYKLDGFVITSSNDTIVGRIKISTSDLNKDLEYSKQKFYCIDTLKKTTAFYPDSTLSVVLLNKGIKYEYRPMNTLHGLRFVLIKNEGEVSLFQVYVSSFKMTFIFNDKAYSIGKDKKTYVVIKDEVNYTLNKNNYKKELKTLFNSEEELKRKIGKKGYKYKDLGKVIDEYNRMNKNEINAGIEA